MFELLLWPYGEALEAMRASATLRKCERPGRIFNINWPSLEFETLKQLWSGKGHIVGRVLVPQSANDDASLFEVWQPECAYALSEADGKYIAAHANVGPELVGANAGIRYFDRIFLTKPRVISKQISSIDAIRPVYYVSAAEADVWRAEGFSGLQFGPVLNHRGQRNIDAELIMATNVLGPMVDGPNIIAQSFTQHGVTQTHPLAIGHIVYAPNEIERAQDFNFTREGLCTYGYPQVVVSKGFLEFYRIRQLKGIRFRAVLNQESRRYVEFIAAVSAFLSEWHEGHPDNRLVGP